MHPIRRNVLRGTAMAAIGLLFAGGTQTASADQPNMHATLRLLNQAEAKLRAATPNKGGHRAKALRLIAEAKQEVQLGIQYARQHRKKK